MIEAAEWGYRPALGDSIAVNGCCLTVAAMEGGKWSFDAIPETLTKTTLSTMNAGDRVNLEHAVSASTLMGGHFVQGHVDGVGRVLAVREGADWRIRIDPGAGQMPFIASKGSICVDGVSLTVAELVRDWFEVALIPTTLELTTLKDLQEGSRVNIETDMIAKTVVNYLRQFSAAKGE